MARFASGKLTFYSILFCTGKRNPKEDLVEKFAEALDVEPAALSNTKPDTIDGLMHTLFDLEDHKSS